MDSCYDDLASEMVFKAVVPDDSWFSIGFGPTMTNTDMILWTVDKGVGRVADLFSFGQSTPMEDPN